MWTFARFDRWRKLRGDELAYEVYKYLADTQTGLFHMNEVNEGLDTLGEFTQVRDPVKIINVYGYAYCGILGPVMAGVCEGMGIGKARTLSLPAWKHSASEVFYDNRWHYLDVDVRAVFRRPDGSLASLEDARRDASLWTNRGPLFFPNDPLESTRQVYEQTRVDRFHGFHQSGHTMDYMLRPGETWKRWWRPQGGRWHHSSNYNQQPWLRRLLEQEPRGPKPNHRNFTVHNHGNGRFVYQPDLTDQSADFALGVADRNNVVCTDLGLTLERDGEGFAVFEVRSPCVIVPKVGNLDTTEDDCEASVVAWDAANTTLAVSRDHGITWQTVPDTMSRKTATGTIVDLTPLVSGRYGYLLKMTLTGRAGEARVRSLKITTWVQVAPASLPALRKGRNRMRLLVGDHHGLNTRVLEVRSFASRPEELLKYLVEPPADYDPQRRTSKIRGPITVKVSAPAGTRIAWFNATGQFRTFQGEAAARTHNSIAFATGRPDEFQTIYQANVPRYASHWNYNVSREVTLTEPVESLYVRYTGDPALNNFAVYAHCLEPRAGTTSPIRVTHVWHEKDHRREQTVKLDGPGEYEIVAVDTPRDESIEIAVPSSRAR